MFSKNISKKFLYLTSTKIRRAIIFVCGIYFLTVMNFAAAGNAAQCDSTWNKSSAAASCGHVCTNPDNVYHYPYSSTYNAATNECTFNAGCCQGLPYQICSYSYAVCDPAMITVKKDDSNFMNDHGKLKHG